MLTNKFNFLILLCLLLTLYFNISSGYTKESWVISEFLINYEGGFVRRGLLGHVLLIMSKKYSIQPYYTVILICLIIYVYVCLFFLYYLKKFQIPFILLLSACLLGGPIIFDFVIRKDCLLIVFFISTIQLIYNTRINFTLNLILINVLGILAILIHESYIFWALIPIIISLAFRINFNQNSKFLNSMVKSLILLLPNFISILACLYFKGNEKIRMIIWDSWGSINFPYNSKEMTEGWAINALGWPFSTGIKMFFSSFYHFSFGVYVPLGIFLSVSISLAFIYRILNLSPHRSSKFSNGKLFLSLFLLQLPGILFLCIMGCDYGRWIFLWFSSSLIMYFLADIKFLEFLSLKTIKFSNLCLKTGSKLYLNKINCYILFLLSGISLVHWNFLSYLYSTPVGYFINLVLYYFDYVTFIGYHSKV